MSADDELGRTIRQLVRERREQTEKEHVAPEDLAAYHDRVLSPQRAEEVEAHLAWCPGCVQALKALDELDGGLDSLPPAAVSSEQVEASFLTVMAAIDEEQGRHRRPWWLVPAAGLAAALLLVALILPWMLRPSGSGAPGTKIAIAGVLSVDLNLSAERSPRDLVTQIRLTPGEHLFVLGLWFPPQGRDSLLRVTVLDSKRRVAWRSKPFKSTAPPYYSSLVMGRDLLSEGQYTVRIETIGQGKTRTVGERVIEILAAP
jgi:hypothetical protein